jgi:carboxymethylenebutenolidase
MQQTQQTVARAEFVDTGDGKRAYFAVPEGAGPFPGVLVFQEAFGVDDYVRSEARRLAAHSYAAIAPDLFDGKTFDYADRESIFARLGALTDETMLAHVRAAAAFLGAQPQVRKAAYGAVGFCMGGRLAVLTAAELGETIAAASSFYGGNMAPDEQRLFTPLLDRFAKVSGELLLIYGAEDQSIEPREHGRIAEALSRLKKAYTLVVYPTAGHAFASHGRKQMYQREPAEDAWRRTFELFDRTLK